MKTQHHCQIDFRKNLPQRAFGFWEQETEMNLSLGIFRWDNGTYVGGDFCLGFCRILYIIYYESDIHHNL
jgi:hypothetical protein